jgi:ATP-dependent Clp protease ATP-binding subunit ClpA
MNAILDPTQTGAEAKSLERDLRALVVGLDEKITRTGVAAARKRFTPEFINRIDKIVTFKPLGTAQLSQILDIELKLVQERIFNSSPQRSFLFEVNVIGDFVWGVESVVSYR